MKFTIIALALAIAAGVSAQASSPVHNHAHLTAEELNLPKFSKESKLASRATKVPFCYGMKAIRDDGERVAGGDVGYVGNTGRPGMYGCNLMLIDASIADLYDYITTIQNTRDVAQECVCWNKIGPDGGINGFFNGNQALKFTVNAGARIVFAAEADTRGGCACGAPYVPLSPWGQFASTWLEFDFGSYPNSGWSGADASALVPAAYNMNINPLNVCDRGICSTIYQDGSGSNAYIPGTDGVDGLGLNLSPGKVRLVVTVG